jgi:hypothetical protein
MISQSGEGIRAAVSRLMVEKAAGLAPPCDRNRVILRATARAMFSGKADLRFGFVLLFQGSSDPPCIGQESEPSEELSDLR